MTSKLLRYTRKVEFGQKFQCKLNLRSNVPLGDVYITSIDPSVLSLDAIALDKADTVSELKALLDIRSPLSIGSSFKLDENGLAIATKVGALAPAGHQVFLATQKLYHQ